MVKKVNISEKINRQRSRKENGEKIVNIWLDHRAKCEAPRPSSPLLEQPRVHFALKTPGTPESEESLADTPVYLDGGYGWVVVLYSFILHFIIDGMSFSFGLIFSEIQLKYASNRTVTSLVASLFLSFPLLFSVVAGIFNDVNDCRKTIMTGGMIGVFCCFCAYHSETLVSFIIFFGVGNGVGLSFLYNAALVVVTYYFNEKIGRATSYATSGTGVGTFCYPFFLTSFRNLLLHFGWEMEMLKSMVFACGVSFAVCAVLGLILIDVEWTTDTKEYKLKKFEKALKQVTEEDFQRPSASVLDCPVRRACSLPSIPTAFLSKLRGDSASVQSVKEAAEKYIDQPARSRSIGMFIRRETLPPLPEYSMIQNEFEHLKHLDLQILNSPNTTLKSTRKAMTSRLSMSVDQINNIDEEDDFFIRPHIDSSTHSLAGIDEHHIIDEEDVEGEEEESTSTTDDSDLSNDGDSSSSELSERLEQSKLIPDKNELTSARPNDHPLNPFASVPSSARLVRNSLAQGMSGITTGRVMPRNFLQQRTPFRSNLLMLGKIPSAPTLSDRKKRRHLFSGRKMTAIMTSISDILREYRTVIKLKVFQIFLMNLAFLYIVLDVPYVYFIDVAKDKLGVPEEKAKWLTSTIGFSNILSTLFYGWLADIPFVKDKLLLFYGMFLSMSAMSMLIAYNFLSFNGLLVACAFFGASVSSNYVWQSIHVTLIFENMTSFQAAYSLATTFEGLANFFGPIICGYIRDMTGSYNTVFALAACMMTLSSCFAILTHFSLMKEREAEAKKPKPEDLADLREIVHTKGVLMMENANFSKLWRPLVDNLPYTQMNGQGRQRIESYNDPASDQLA